MLKVELAFASREAYPWRFVLVACQLESHSTLDAYISGRFRDVCYPRSIKRKLTPGEGHLSQILRVIPPTGLADNSSTSIVPLDR